MESAYFKTENEKETITTDIQQVNIPKKSLEFPDVDIFEILPINEDSTNTLEDQILASIRSNSNKPTEKQNWVKFVPVCTMCVMVAFGGFINGWDVGTIGGFLGQTDFKKRFGELNSNNVYYISTIRTGLIVSIFNIGCAIGSVTLGRLGDVYGRRKGLMIGSIIFIVGVVIEISSTIYWYQYMIGRLIAGTGMGVIAVLSPMLIGEVSPKQIRGAMVSCYQLMITFGIFLGTCCNFGTKTYGNSAQWRIGVGLQFLWCIIMVCAMAIVPESPRFLIQKEKYEEAKKSIAKSNRSKVDDKITIDEFEIVMSGVEAERSAGEAKWMEAFETKNKTFQRVSMGVIVLALQQLTGINYFFYYGTIIFVSVGLNDSFQTAIIFSIVNFASTFLALYVVDRFGRRKCLLYGSAGLSVCMVVFASIGATSLYPNGYDQPTSSWAGNVMIVFSCLFIFTFAITWAPVPFVILAETFPLRIRSKGMALGTLSNQLWTFMVGFFSPWIANTIHFSYGYVFLGCCVFAFIYCFFYVPETKGLVLEDVNVLWEEGIPPWKSANWVPPECREEVSAKILT